MENIKSLKDFNEAPKLVQFIYACRISRIPVGMSSYMEAIEKYPEYFKDEKRLDLDPVPDNEVKELKLGEGVFSLMNK